MSSVSPIILANYAITQGSLRFQRNAFNSCKKYIQKIFIKIFLYVFRYTI